MATKVKRALISVSDKRGIVNFARELDQMNVEIISTGGTYKKIKDSGIKVKKVEEITGFAEMMDGRVKTLHPFIHGGLLADRKNSKHMSEVKKLGISLIDMVVVNLYPFQETVSKPDVKLEEAVENIDIGGPTMIRSAAKNYKSVAVVVDPEDYGKIIEEMEKNGGTIGGQLLFNLCVKSFQHTYQYDEVIFNYFNSLGGEKESNFREGKGGFKPKIKLDINKMQDLRYGENPHQQAAYYKYANAGEESFVKAKQVQGKALSYNNILDSNAAFNIVKEFKDICVSVIKHNNPCGASIGDSVRNAYQKAYECDPVSAFGSVVATNIRWSKEASEYLKDKYVEVLIAPDFEDGALEVLSEKTNLRILKVNFNLEKHLKYLDSQTFKGVDIKSVDGGLLIQDFDGGIDKKGDMKEISDAKPSQSQWKDLLFGWQITKSVKSNAIVLVEGGKTVGIGAGQMSRVDAVKIAIDKAGGKAEGSVMASDAFFPFKDAIEIAADNKISAIIQPGGSVRDEEVIEACNKYGISMVFTGKRHFKH
ncbi:MAG: bifunctional phosphoribosylaminoimidazolecarboxamide formyltransferase/IMP cyclohydrolase [Candidatus Humimicrobiaceae bacterium]